MSTWLHTPHLRIRYKGITIALSEVERWELRYYNSKPKHEGIVFYFKSKNYRSMDHLRVGEAEYLQEEMDKVIERLNSSVPVMPVVIRPYAEVLKERKEQEEKAIALESEKNPPQVEVPKPELEPIIEKVPVKKSIWSIFGN